MNIDQKIIDRFDQLIKTGKQVLKTRYTRSGGGIVYMGDDGVNRELSNEWAISCLNLLGRVFGTHGDHYQKFNALFPKSHDYSPFCLHREFSREQKRIMRTVIYSKHAR